MKTNISEEKDNTTMNIFPEQYFSADEQERIKLIRAILEGKDAEAN